MKRVGLIFALLLLTVSAHAATIYEIPEDKGLFRRAFERAFEKVAYCKWRVPCYWQEDLGATIQTIAAADRISDSRSTLNTIHYNINSELLGTLTPARITATSTSASSTIQWGLEVYDRPIAVGGANATTTIRGNATSTFNAGVSATALDVRSTAATSTFGNGISLTNGCITMPNGSCAITSGLTGDGAANRVTYYTGATTLAGDADFTRDELGFIATNGTTTSATTTNHYVSGHASTTRETIGALGVGVSTTTQRNAQIAGDVQLTGNLSVAGNTSGIVRFLDTPVVSIDRALTSGSYTAVDISASTTPDTARFAIINVYFTCSVAAAPNSDDGCYFKARKNGGTAPANMQLQWINQVNGNAGAVSGQLIVPLDASQQYQFIFDKRSGVAATVRLIIELLGYIK